MEDSNVTFLPTTRDIDTPAPTRENKLAKAMERLGATDDALLAGIIDLATQGVKRTIVRNGEGKVVSETLVEDPAIRLKALKTLLELKEDKPKKIQRAYGEKIEW
jgi:hypothetical protein